MFDLHIIHAITNGIKYFKADRSLFDPLFKHVSATYRERMFNKFAATPVYIDGAFNVKTAKDLPLITVELSETRYDGQGLGLASFAQYTDTGTIGFSQERFIHEFNSQRVMINVYVGELELMRVLHHVIKAAILLFTRKLLEAGYQNIVYEGTNALEPVPELRATGDLIVYGRQCVYSALQIIEIPYKIEDINNIGAAEVLLDIQVQNADFDAAELPSGVSGGVLVV